MINNIEIKKVDKLDLSEVWYDKNDYIFECDEVFGSEHFYPLYKWNNFYCYSPLKLLKLKGNLDFNPAINKYLINGEIKSYLPPTVFIDRQIKRVGGPIICLKAEICTEELFLKEFVGALIRDIRYLEDINKNATFGILTGGKDSLNLLLLPWRQKVYAFSAEPNYKLVREFCEINNLNIEVIKLDNAGEESLDWIENEALIGCCRVGLSDIRWSENLFKIKNQFQNRNEDLVIMTGSMADSFLTPYYKKYRCYWENDLYNKILNNFKTFKSILFQTSWTRGAQWQGVFHGIIRENSRLLNYSAYHGKNVIGIIQTMDLERIITYDIREKIGERIIGRKVIYPTINPSPSIWNTRQKFSTVEKFKSLFKFEK